MSIRSEVFEVVKAIPGITSPEVGQLMTHVKQSAVDQALSAGYIMGHLLREDKPCDPKPGGRSSLYSYSVAERVVPPVRAYKRKTPTPAGVNATVSALKAELAELKTWKAQAIARYPDLLVSPEVLAARKLVAGVFKAKGDVHAAQEVLDGKRDNAVPVQAVLLALGETV